MRISFRNEGEIKTFSDKEKLRKFIVSTPALKQMQEEIVNKQGNHIGGKLYTKEMEEELQN